MIFAQTFYLGKLQPRPVELKTGAGGREKQRGMGENETASPHAHWQARSEACHNGAERYEPILRSFNASVYSSR